MDRDSELDLKVKDLLRDARTADKVDRERAELFGSMIKSSGWKQYVELLELRLQSLADEILKPSGSIDAMIGLEYVKGAMSGLILARDLPSVTIMAMDQLRRERNALEGVEDEESSDG